MAFEIRYYNAIHDKDDIEFVTEFPCFLGHPVSILSIQNNNNQKSGFLFGPNKKIVLWKQMSTITIFGKSTNLTKIRKNFSHYWSTIKNCGL